MAARIMPLAQELGLHDTDAPDVTVLPVAAGSEHRLAREADFLLSRSDQTGALADLPRIESARDFLTERVARRQRGVFVVGMHRSGTSAMARIVNLLGVPLSLSDDLLPAGPDNPTGFWESRTAILLNARLVRDLGGAVFQPPEITPGWENADDLASFRWEAREQFAAVLPTEQWALKDPRLCFTLPFWRTALDVEPVVVMPFRNPLEVARSLEVRDGITRLHALDLWERHVRASLDGAQGLPLSVHSFEDLVDDPPAQVARLRAFLVARGFRLRDWDDELAAEVRSFLQRDLRHHRHDAEELRRFATPAQVALYERLTALGRAPAAAPRQPEGPLVASL
jgi:hypothetical protein